ncbi:hypothetical protein FRC00_000505, partial [Tulasnella sp. 408]
WRTYGLGRAVGRTSHNTANLEDLEQTPFNIAKRHNMLRPGLDSALRAFGTYFPARITST